MVLRKYPSAYEANFGWNLSQGDEVLSFLVGFFAQEVLPAPLAGLPELGIDTYFPKRLAGSHVANLYGSFEKTLFVVVEEAEDVVLFEALAAAQEVEFHGEGQAGDFAAQLLD